MGIEIMLTLKNLKYLIMISIILFISNVPMDIFKFGDTRLGVFIGVYSLIFCIITFVVAFVMFIEDMYDDKDFYFEFLGKDSYSFIWTFSILPALIYAFFIAENGIIYGVMGIFLFLFWERIRTIQNRYAQEYRDEELKNEAMRKNYPPEEVEIK